MFEQATPVWCASGVQFFNTGDIRGVPMMCFNVCLGLPHWEELMETPELGKNLQLS